MSARVLPSLAQAGVLKETISDIDARIFSIGLYAGLMEDIAVCCDGEPAAFHEKLHLLQRKHYMDEECLLNYRHGGMEFKNIEAFDAWLCLPENRDRTFPFPRTMLAMQVRRKTKERDWDGSLGTALINIQLDQADRWTYLYIRNGERVSRLSCDLAFDELVFPSREMMNLSEPMMMKARSYGNVEELITMADFEQRSKAHAERQAAAKAWDKANPKPRSHWSNPYRDDGFCFRSDQWHPFNPSSVFFDDASRGIHDRIQKYNRIALLIQGLFDRSDALHPHPPVRTWTPDGFAAAVELVYTGTNVLVNGEAPDFEAYRARCNASLSADSVVIGQEMYWLEREAEKERKRRDADWRNKSDYRPTTFKPYGNPGPGSIARIKTWKPRTKQALFEWTRERLKEDTWSGKYRGDAIKTTLTVPEGKLFNVSAYRTGDYKQFFADHRTRAQYLRWAPMLLTAEEFHAGNLPVR